MRLICLRIIFIISISGFVVYPLQPTIGQTAHSGGTPDSSRSIPGMIVDDVITAWNDGLLFFSAPLRYDEYDWAYTAAILGGTALIMSQDEELREIAFRNADVSSSTKDVLDIGLKYGDVLTAWIISAGFYVPGLISDAYFEGKPFGQGEFRTIGRLLGQSLFYSGTIAVIMRSILGRKRPNDFDDEEGDPWEFNMLNFDAERNAFPSGHSTITFSISTTIAEYLDSWLARGILYPLALLGAYESYLSDRHWTSDIFLGAAIGVVSGLFVVNQEKERQEILKTGARPEAPRVSIYPQQGGIGISYRF